MLPHMLPHKLLNLLLVQKDSDTSGRTCGSTCRRVLSHWPHVRRQVCVARSSSEQMTSLARKCVGHLCGNMWPVWKHFYMNLQYYLRCIIVMQLNCSNGQYYNPTTSNNKATVDGRLCHRYAAHDDFLISSQIWLELMLEFRLLRCSNAGNSRVAVKPLTAEVKTYKDTTWGTSCYHKSTPLVPMDSWIKCDFLLVFRSRLMLSCTVSEISSAEVSRCSKQHNGCIGFTSFDFLLVFYSELGLTVVEL